MGGAERVVEMLAEGTSRQGIEVGVAHIAPQPNPPQRRNGVDVYPLAHRNPLWIEDSARHPSLLRNINKIATLFNVFTAHDFERLLATYKPDIVHSHSMVEMTPRMWKLSKDHGASVVHTLHDYDLLCIRAALFKDGQQCTKRHFACSAFSWVKRRYHEHIDRVVGVSNAILSTHLEHGFFERVPEVHRHVVWNPVRSILQETNPPKRNKDRPYTFGFLGRLVPEKGILTLLDACRLLGTGDWQLKIAGRAPNDDSFLYQHLQGLPVELVGFVDPNEFLKEIDILIVPSIWLEPFGLTIVEAYAAGVAVLGSNIAGVAEIIGAVDPTALVTPNDPVALANKMKQLIATGIKPATVGDYAAVLQRTQPDYVVGQYLDIYRAALRDNSRSAN
jgi:glycosyltransferase involved in cell wall biosynthesis